MTAVEAFPLQWPTGRPRTPSHQRTPARFKKVVNKGTRQVDGSTAPYTYNAPLSVAQARDRLFAELDRMGARHIVISTNLALRNDGLPRSNQAEPADPGVAVYFTIGGQPRCLSCDRWNKVAGNMAALAAHVDAMRGQMRWGVASAEQMFAGFKALPPGSPASDSSPESAVAAAVWCAVWFHDRCGESIKTNTLLTDAAIWRRVYITLAKALHPDTGGKLEDFQRLQTCKQLIEQHLETA